MLIAFGVTGSFAFAPLIASASDSTVLLATLQKAIDELNGSNHVTRRISPVGATSCFISGLCAAHAKQSLAAGNVTAAVSFTCGAASAQSADRLAANYGY